MSFNNDRLYEIVAISSFFIATSLLIAISFALNNLIMSTALQKKSPLSLALVYRSIPAIPFILGMSIILFGTASLTTFTSLKLLLLMILTASLLTMGDFLLMYGLGNFPVRIVIPALAINPLITLIWLVVTGLETVTFAITVGAILTISGIIIITFQRNEQDLELKDVVIGGVIGLVAALIFGTMGYIDTFILSSFDTNGFTFNGVKILILCLIGVLIFLIFPSQRNAAKLETKEQRSHTIKYLLLSGVVGWIIGASLMFYTIDNIGGAIVIPIVNIHPMISVVMLSIMGIDKLNKMHYLGIIMTIIGTLVIAL